jgi:hypothetical protein
MPNEREALIEAILARRQDPEPRPLDLNQSGCPGITVLMNVALGQVPPAERRWVEEHAAACPDCRTRLAAYRAFLTDEEVTEAPYEGSLLQQIAESEFARKVPPRESDAATRWPGRGPDCVDVTLLMARALDQAPADKVREVDAHCAHCEGCRTLLAEYRTWFRDDAAIPEPPYEGSLLEQIAERREFVLKRPPSPGDADEPADRRNDLHDAVPVGSTSLAQSRESWPELARGLRLLWLPYLLEYVGLDASHTEAMLSYIEQRIPIRPNQRLSALLPSWLADFARSVIPAAKDVPPLVIDRPLVERIALRRVLDPAAEHETPDQRRFREAARTQAFTSVADLLGYLPAGEEPRREVLEYRSYLYSRGEEVVADGIRLLQVA